MKRILIGWLAYNNDFIKKEDREIQIDKVNSPNYLFHKYFYKQYDCHIMLYSGKGDETGAIKLKNLLQTDFPEHKVDIRSLEISDPIDLTEIKPKVEAQLLEFSDCEIDIFFSPGTSIMQVAWYICHNTLKLKTHLLQTRAAQFTKTGKPDIHEITIEQSHVPITSILKEKNLDKREKEPFSDADHLITASLEPVYKKAEKIAQTDHVTVLIQGETGTGKEHLAWYIHENSIRKSKSYLTINCSAFSDGLLESRLFGYTKGAFTGADKDKKGLFEIANGGTLFLDEIGDISPYMQQALLRAVQEKEIQPIGGNMKKINVRIIAATNKNLVEMCHEGKFRWDLYYRLAVAELELPQLLERGANETEEYIDFFLKRKQKELGKEKLLKPAKEVKQFLYNYPWPGNIRELENLVETLYVYCDEKVTVKDIPLRFKEIPDKESLLWEDVEKLHIEKVLKLKKGNQRQTQLAIGYGSINTLKSKIEEYGIDVDSYK